MAIQVPNQPDAFFLEFIPAEFERNRAGRPLPPVPYSIRVKLSDGKTYGYRIADGKLAVSQDGAAAADVRVMLALEDFRELVRASRSHLPDAPPPPPPIPPTFLFPPIETLAGRIRVVVDDLGDKRTVDVALGSVADDAPPKTTVHTTVDFVAGLQGKTLAVEQIIKSGGVRIEGDMGYLLRIANAFTAKTRRRER